ncbi:multidrug efflux pump subunit AcrB [Paraburkholderia sp. MM5384-R2]|nr:multidrug efflux pump subunit AcrB [Paraburkholderia sp. MM5384-R2]
MITSIIALSALGQTINIMTLGGLALAVGILVEDATVAIENNSHQLEQGKTLEQAILDGAHQIAIPTLVSTRAICIVFVPMFLLTGVAHYLFIPLAEAVVFAMLASYFFSRTLVPTLASRCCCCRLSAATFSPPSMPARSRCTCARKPACASRKPRC